MKRIITHVNILCVLSLSIILHACKADVDLNNIDMSAAIETSLSLPLGSMSLKLGDFLGDSTIQGVYVDANGQYIYSHTAQFSHDLNTLIDLNDLKKTGEYTFDFAKEVFANYPQYQDYIIPAGQTLDFIFPIDITLDNINADLETQRLDSIVVDLFRFYTRISPVNMNLSNKDIQKIDIEILNGFSSAKGNKISAPISQYGLGQEMPIEMEDVHIVLMKDPHAAPSPNNILDSIKLNVHIQIKTTHDLQMQSTSALSLNIRVDELDFDAVFGYVKMPNLLQDSILDHPIEKFWDSWKAFDGTILPLNRPSILFTIEHGFSVPLAATVNALNVSSKEGEYRHATFDGSKTKTFHFPSKIAMDAPYNATTIDSIRMDYTKSNGNIDELLTIHPDKVSYDYLIGIDSTSTQQQYRITNNTHLEMALNINIPFEFKENVHFAYTDTIRDVNLTAFQLDSLLAEAEFVEEIEKAELKLYLTIENWIPFNIEALVTFFTADGNNVTISSMTNDRMELILQQPESIVDGLVSKPSTNQIILNVTTEDFEKIASIDHIELQAKLKDNNTMVKLTPDAAIMIKAGVTADIKAIVDFNNVL